MKDPKVFCIGFHKTGTTTLAEALRHLGYRVTGPNGVLHPDITRVVNDMVWQLVDQFDAFLDNPWPILYKELDRRYPGSKFILTLRPTSEWIASIVGHFGQVQTPMRTWIYGVGSPIGNEEIYVSRYERHNAAVTEYFAHRHDDLLCLRITQGDGWDKLCSFLEQDTPAIDFPHRLKAADREERQAARDRQVLAEPFQN